MSAEDEKIEQDSATDSAVPTPKPRSRGVYLLPNLFTTASLFSGFYAIVAAMNGHYENAAMAMFVSMVLDTLDGRVARMTNTQSAFGAEYDSLADMVAFGVAPALVAFTWAMGDLGKIGWTAAFIYVAGAALRLARFNTQIGSTDKKYFVGLPSPAAAGLVAGMVWASFDTPITPWLAWLTAGVVAVAGLLMVSNVFFYSFKELDLKGRVPFFVVLLIVLGFAVVATAPAQFLWLVFIAYALSGPVLSLHRRWRRSH